MLRVRDTNVVAEPTARGRGAGRNKSKAGAAAQSRRNPPSPPQAPPSSSSSSSFAPASSREEGGARRTLFDGSAPSRSAHADAAHAAPLSMAAQAKRIEVALLRLYARETTAAEVDEAIVSFYEDGATFSNALVTTRGLLAARSAFRLGHLLGAACLCDFFVAKPVKVGMWTKRDGGASLLMTFAVVIRPLGLFEFCRLRQYTHLDISPQGRIREHRDEWSAASLAETFVGPWAAVRLPGVTARALGLPHAASSPSAPTLTSNVQGAVPPPLEGGAAKAGLDRNSQTGGQGGWVRVSAYDVLRWVAGGVVRQVGHHLFPFSLPIYKRILL